MDILHEHYENTIEVLNSVKKIPPNELEEKRESQMEDTRTLPQLGFHSGFRESLGGGEDNGDGQAGSSWENC